jgi:hypothetical protein
MHTGQNSIAPENSLPQLGQVRFASVLMDATALPPQFGRKSTAPSTEWCKIGLSDPIRQLEINTEHNHRKRPKHGEVSLSEIDDVCGPINEHESKRDQGINTADAEAGEEKLESYAHRHCGGSTALHSLCKFLTL